MAKRRNKPAELLPEPAAVGVDPEFPVAVASPASAPDCPCCGDLIQIPFKVDQEFKDAEGATYMVRVTQAGCLAPGAVPVSFQLNLEQLPTA